MPGEIQGKSAPAATDVEYAVTSLQEEFRGDVALLGELGFIERLIWVLEVGAGILPIGIQEEIVETAIEIVVMSDVALSAAFGVSLMQRPQRPANALTGSCEPWWDLP